MSIPNGDLSFSNALHTAVMDMERIHETRRKRLLSAALDKFERRGLQKNLADLLSVPPNYISRILSHPSKPGHKGIGEEMARHAEEKLGKPEYWLDGRDTVYDDWPFSRITPERLSRLNGNEMERLETVIETTLTLMESERPGPTSPPRTA